MEINKESIRQFYKRLNHKKWGVSELIALTSHSRKVVATGFFNDEDRFVSACYAYGGGCEVYVGVQPRRSAVSRTKNLMNIVDKKKGRVLDVQYITAVCFNIVQVKAEYQGHSKTKHQTALNFVRTLQGVMGGDIDNLGDAISLWIPFITPIRLTTENRVEVERQLDEWKNWMRQRYYIESMRLGYDFKIGFTDLQRVVGTYNHEGKTGTQCMRCGGASDRVRNQILSLNNDSEGPRFRMFFHSTFPDPTLPLEFKKMLGWSASLKTLWTTDGVAQNAQQRDWDLGQKCVSSGMVNPEHLKAILMAFPNGHYQITYDKNYVQNMVRNLLARKKKSGQQLKL